ncbi:MAG: hypothetical protein OXG82_05400 [Gammaproteobacteria bacterium]|nr:hypothetical protein [Gammaproteobacteria bacterium]
MAPEHLADGVTLGALARHNDISRNLIWLWAEKYQAGEFDDDVQAALMAALSAVDRADQAGQAVVRR